MTTKSQCSPTVNNIDLNSTKKSEKKEKISKNYVKITHEHT